MNVIFKMLLIIQLRNKYASYMNTQIKKKLSTNIIKHNQIYVLMNYSK